MLNFPTFFPLLSKFNLYSGTMLPIDTLLQTLATAIRSPNLKELSCIISRDRADDSYDYNRLRSFFYPNERLAGIVGRTRKLNGLEADPKSVGGGAQPAFCTLHRVSIEVEFQRTITAESAYCDLISLALVIMPAITQVAEMRVVRRMYEVLSTYEYVASEGSFVDFDQAVFGDNAIMNGRVDLVREAFRVALLTLKDD
ncbi:hypothetical protein ABW19_dt0205713 [Dactylella cylindrospora]|nr:hypothetical protein ABW19_dt0205713 [Dactylella cylindrospora]